MKRRTMLKGAVVGLSGTATATTGAAETEQECDIVVSASCDGNFKSIGSAASEASSGETICGKPGVYEEEVWVETDDMTFRGNPGKSETLGAGQNRPIIDGASLTKEHGAGFRTGRARGTTIKGFEIRNFKQPAFGTGITAGPFNITISDNYLHGFSANGIARAGFGQVNPHDYTGERNQVEKTAKNEIRLDNVSDTVAQNNIVENERWGLKNGTEETISAERNHSGSPTGPRRRTPGKGTNWIENGDVVFGPVDLIPWEPTQI
ncbi:DUF1565 domain-containing protein [Halodesulfurarchaeum sp.]|uniref:DUF1565 domain-containing protein n=1 Tax=Halodesulfurarchaeum sp. TaxID=1980530 RepID=UPI002FC3166B